MIACAGWACGPCRGRCVGGRGLRRPFGDWQRLSGTRAAMFGVGCWRSRCVATWLPSLVLGRRMLRTLRTKVRPSWGLRVGALVLQFWAALRVLSGCMLLAGFAGGRDLLVAFGARCCWWALGTPSGLVCEPRFVGGPRGRDYLARSGATFC